MFEHVGLILVERDLAYYRGDLLSATCSHATSLSSACSHLLSVSFFAICTRSQKRIIGRDELSPSTSRHKGFCSQEREEERKRERERERVVISYTTQGDSEL